MPEQPARVSSALQQREAYYQVFAGNDSSLGNNMVQALVPTEWFNKWELFSGRHEFENATSRDYVFNTPPAEDPGPVDMAPYLEADSEALLVPGLKVGEHLLGLSLDAWDVLTRFHPSSGPPVHRRYITGPSSGLRMELYPLALHFCSTGDYDEGMKRHELVKLTHRDRGTHEMIYQSTPLADISQRTVGMFWTVRDLGDMLVHVSGINRRNMRISIIPNYPVLEVVHVIPVGDADDLKTLTQAGITTGSMVLVEDVLDFGTPPAVCYGIEGDSDNEYGSYSYSGAKRNAETNFLIPLTTYTNNSTDNDDNDDGIVVYGTGANNRSSTVGEVSNWSSSSYTRAAPSYVTDPGQGVALGICGLNNLGNTCYMNSALQCLLHVPELCSYFLSGHYKLELNTDNPLGHKGEVATAYADLLRLIWSRKRYESVRPTLFKTAIGKCNDLFAGFGQQDSQELLAFLLDGIHEDLNRQIKKEYTEAVDVSQFPSLEAAADEAWTRHLKRHRSVIVDHFQGQFQSTVVCCTCQKQYVHNAINFQLHIASLGQRRLIRICTCRFRCRLKTPAISLCCFTRCGATATTLYRSCGSRSPCPWPAPLRT